MNQVGDLHIEDRSIPAYIVNRFLQFMANVQFDRCGEEIHFGFPSSGTYHDLVRHYFDEFRVALEENSTLESISIYLESHGVSDFDHTELWGRIGEAIASCAGVVSTTIRTDNPGNLNTADLCAFLSRLNVETVILEGTGGTTAFLFGNEDLRSLSRSVSTLTKLGRFVMYDVKFSQSIDPFFADLARCANLRNLTLEFDYESGLRCQESHFQKFLKESQISVMKLRSEKYLDEAGDVVEESFARQLSEGIAYSSVKELTFNISNFHQFTSHLISSLRNASLASLEFTSVDSKLHRIASIGSIFAEPADSLFNLLHNNKCLEYVGFSLDNLSHESQSELLDRLGNVLTHNKSGLKRLYIEGHLKGDSILKFSRHLGGMQNLEELDVDKIPVRASLVTESFLLDASRSFCLRRLSLNGSVGDLGPVEAATKLNKNGRAYLRLDPNNHYRATEVFEAVRDDLDCIYFHLRENPSFVAKGQ